MTGIAAVRGVARNDLPKSVRRGRRRPVPASGTPALLALAVALALAGLGAPPARAEGPRASTTFDCAAASGTLSPWLAGTTEGPFYSEESYPLLRDNGFKLAETLLIWLTPRDRGPQPGGMSPRPGSGQPGGGEFGRPRLDQGTFPRAPGGGSGAGGFAGPGGQGGAPGGLTFDADLQTAKRQLASLVRAGVEPLVFMTAASKPADPAAFQELARRAATELQATAREAGKKLLLFRFGNEPEAPRYWSGTRDDFFETYRLWATAVKSVSPSFIVEAPGFASATKLQLRDEPHDQVHDFAREFLRYCQVHQVPLDIFSFHFYGTRLANLERELRAVEAELAKYPALSPLYGEPRIGVDEWNIEVFGMESGRYQKVFDTAHTAAHNVAALILMARHDVTLSVRFGGVNGRRPQAGGGAMGGGRPPVEPDFLMVDGQGRGKPALAGFKAFNSLSATPGLLAVREEQGQLALAGRSGDGHSITVVVSAYDPELAQRSLQENRDDLREAQGTAEIRLRNPPREQMGGGVTVRTWAVNEGRELAPAETRVVSAPRPGEDLVWTLPRVVPSVTLVQLSW